MTGMVADLEPDTARMKKAAGEGYATATDLADWLVRALKIPFRDAHHLTGRIVAKAAETGVALHRLPLAAMREIEPQITDDVFSVLSVDRSVKSRSEFRRHGAQKRACASEEMAAQAGKGEILTFIQPGLALIAWFAMVSTT